MTTRLFLRLQLCLVVPALIYPATVAAAPALTVEINAGYNFVVDSNVLSPSTFAPTVATVGAEVCNYGTDPLTDVTLFVGNYAALRPGTYPARDSSSAAFIAEHPHLANTGSYSLTHVGGSLGTADATRFVGSLGVGECRFMYWHVTYPRRANPNNSGVEVWGLSNTPNDDLWLNWDAWATSAQGAVDSDTQRATMRNEISAFANKIEPSGGVWFNEPSTVAPGQTITSNGINYDLGNINQGFDNDGDLVPDYNAWLQPVGDLSFDPSCYRLIRTSGQVVINRSGGNPDTIIDFVDQLYFTNLPMDNTGGNGVVYYTYMALDGPCSTALTPYQEVASGSDNEKFSGDFGTSLPRLTSSAPTATLDKTVSASSIAAGGTLTFDLDFANTGTAALGRPDFGVPLTVRDQIPAGTTYVSGSAGYTLGFMPNTGARILYSTDDGTTWSSSEPVPASSVTDLAWWLNDAFPAGATGSVTFQVLVDSPFLGIPFIENTGSLRLDGGTPFLEDTTVTLVTGPNSIGDLVFHDQNRSGDFTGGEPGLPNVTVELYYDRNGDGLLDAGDILISATSSSALGAYAFNNLPNGDFLVVVDIDDPDLPLGYAATTDIVIPVIGLGTTTASPFNTADFGFAPPIELTKTLLTASPATEGSLVTYQIDLDNFIVAPTGEPCEFITWGTNEIGNQWDNPLNLQNAAGPDGLFASALFNGNPHAIVNTFDLNAQLGAGVGNIIKVEALAWIYLNGSLSNDQVDALINRGGALFQSDTFTAVDVNGFAPTQGNGGLLIWDVTGVGGWLWTHFNGTGLSIDLGPDAVGSADGVRLFGDAFGFRVTTDQTCGVGQAGTTVAVLPVTDTYDPALLQFVSASVTPTTVGGGTITWANLAALINNNIPLTVTFRALEPPDTDNDGEADPANLLNTACTSGGSYVDGRPTNSDCGSATTTLQPRGTISGTLWNDSGIGGGVGSNGLQDGAEVGIPGVTVELRQGGVLIATAITDANGDYSFEGLADGTYTVIVLPATLPGTTFTQTGDPDVTLNHQTTVTLNQNDGNPANDDAVNQDFGYIIPNTVYGSVWRDVDGDGVQESGEEGFAGVTVRLLDCGVNAMCGDGDDGATRTVVTDANGDYVFGDLPNGNYQVVVDTTTLPAGVTWAQTVDPDATVDNRTTATLVVAGGNLYGAYEFAYRPTGTSTIGDLLYQDWDGDGSFDSGEDGIANVTVYLYEDQDGDGVVDPEDALVATTVSNVSGAYLFTGLGAGSYTVVVDTNDADLPGSWVQTDDPDVSLDNRSGATVNGVNSVLTLDFGYQPLGGGAIGDTVFNDVDADGIFDATESGIAGITVNLYEDSNGNGVIDASDALIATAFTDINGNYLFDDLPAGRYLVDVDQTDTNLPVDANGNRYVISTANDPALVILAANEIRSDVDFGFTRGAIISDTLWRDDNGDGAQSETEAIVPNVTVRLYNDVNGDGDYDVGVDTLVATDITDVNGLYEFSGLPAGNYVVVVDLTDPDLPSTTVTGDPDTTLNGQTGLSVLPGDVIKFADFGFQPPGVIGDLLWIDSDLDGVFDINEEQGIAGVTIRLETPGGVVLATTTTDSEGRYSFGDLADGSYVVVVDTTTLPAGLALNFDPDEGNNCAVCNNRGSVTLVGGAIELDIDFGYEELPIPDLIIDKDTSTPTVVAGGTVTYTIRVQNPGTAISRRVTIADTLPAGFTFAANTAIDEDLATRTLTSNPTAGASNLSWGQWDIDPLGSVLIRFTVNVASSVTAGTYDNTASASYDFNNDGTQDTTINDDGTLPQDSDTPPTQDPEDDEDVTVAVAPILTITKSSNGGASVDPGDTITYTIVVTNNGKSTANNVRVIDAVPTGTTYVAASAQVQTPTNGTNATYRDDFDPTAAYTGSDGTITWSTTWTEIGEANGVAAGNVRVLADGGDNALRFENSVFGASRVASLTGYRFATLSFNYRPQGIDVGESVTVEVSSNGTIFTTLATYAGPLDAASYTAASFDISAFRSATTTIRFQTSGLDNNDFFFVDDVQILATPRATQTFAAHAPSGLVVAADGYDLYADDGISAAETMTVTFQVTVNNPAPLGQTTVDNTAFTSSDELPIPVSDDASDLLNSPFTATIGDLVWNDADNDGMVDGGEAGMSNIRLLLYSPGTDNMFGTGDDVLIDSVFTNSSGFYQFVGLAAGLYRVVVDDTSLPAGYQLTTGNEPLDVTLISNSQNFTTADFGYRHVPSLLPVTLQTLSARPGKGGLEIRFATATETGNLGFFVWGRRSSGEDWRRLNKSLLASKAVDSVVPQAYTLTVRDAALQEILLQDVDREGASRWHGPFAVGRIHGRPVALEAVPWKDLARLRALNQEIYANDLGKRPIVSVLAAVTSQGIYRVSDAQLKAAGVNWTGEATRNIGVTHRGQAWPFRLFGPATWGPSSALEFVGEASDSPYQAENIYRLEIRGAAAPAPATVDDRPVSGLSTATTMAVLERKIEVDRAYSFAAPNNDPWYDEWMLANGAALTKTFRITLDQVADTKGAQLALELWGVTNWPAEADHHLIVEVEGEVLGDYRFDGLVNFPLKLDLPESALADNVIDLTLRLPLDHGVPWDLVALDSYSVSYARKLLADNGRLNFATTATSLAVGGLTSNDVSVYRRRSGQLDLLSQVVLSKANGTWQATFRGNPENAEYFVADASGRLAPTLRPVDEPWDPRAEFGAQVEALVISHRDFIEDLGPWVAARRAQGLAVEVVDVERLYALYSGNMVDPEALKRFVREVAAEHPELRALMLVGGDSFDYRNNLGLGAFSFLPSPYAPTGGLVKFAPVDPLYGDLDDDNVPDLAVGRLPVRSAAELQTLITKILAYDTIDYPGTALFLSDGFDAAASISFKNDSVDLAASLGSSWQVETAAIDDLGVAGARAEIFSTLQEGVALTQYYGHSGPNLWSFQGLFTSSDAAALANADSPTAVMQWGCWNTYYVSPSFNTLGHALLLRPNGAAIVMGAATLTEPSSDLELAHRLLPLLALPDATFGGALAEAKRLLALEQPGRIDVLRGWTLLGDPTQKVPR